MGNHKVPHPRCVYNELVWSVSICLTQLYDHKVRYPRCVYNELDWSVYTCLTQLYGGRVMYNLLHKEQLHVSALFIVHLQVDKFSFINLKMANEKGRNM